ncbi:Cu(I)/Ag(I) efflux system membrane fusion protein [Neolewinella xylanilytica]|uniref:Cu(I)/Ag(I) efflux system membrane fusion protein n=1 Tax=Neolewinella xylanilytica TaxID=1514080 RepID=A0A2S6I2D8_9BACT|nr:efflux RND transporter periplasmic adaptor subunit [Neolewinella xylanilytica]PPK85346.1 Cu(I)/Ag(I) efflux system membrane fusion protein [Neolewinella xylanilytica]
MKTQTILYVLFALLLGLLGGYLLFGTSTANDDPDHASHSADQHAGQTSDSQTWTCSMHPQIQREEPGDCPICGMDLIPLAETAGSDPAVLTMSEAAVALARVRTTAVGLAGDAGETEQPSEADSERTLTLTGRLAADERTAAVESVDFGGRLERLFVTFAGEQVRAGQRIATIYSPELVVAQEELLEALRLQTLSPELLTAARNKLRNLEITDEQIAEIESSGEVMTEFPVYADRAGTVLEIRARVGDYVSAGAPLYTLTNLDRLWALFDAYEGDLSRIDVGDPVTFTVASLPGETFRARVSFIDPLLDPATRTASVRAEVNNARSRLKPQMFITGRLETGGLGGAPIAIGEENGPLFVPRTAVLWTGERSVVYVEIADAEVPTYEFREVELGDPTGGGYLVNSGLQAGERVVTNGAFQIDAAAQLNNQLSMMNRDVRIQGRDEAGMTAMPVADYRDETPAAFRDQLATLVQAYLPLKDRMVASEPVGAAVLDPLAKALEGVDMMLLEDEPHQYWMEQLNALNGHLEALAGTDDLEEQRRQFGFFSQALINTLTAFGTNGELYVQRCPMAFNNEGANWISEQSAIRNPYFGDAMLTCGSTIDTLTNVN